MAEYVHTQREFVLVVYSEAIQYRLLIIMILKDMNPNIQLQLSQWQNPTEKLYNLHNWAELIGTPLTCQQFKILHF